MSYTNSRLSVADNFVDLTANDYSYLYSDSYLRTPGYLLDGKLYNLPIATGGGMYMFYNKDVLAASGITEVPTTWDAFLADCEAIKANGISPVYYSGVDTWTLQFFALMGWYSDYAPEDAQAFAIEDAQIAAKKEARKRGAKGEITVTYHVDEKASATKDGAIYLGTTVSAYAVGAVSF